MSNGWLQQGTSRITEFDGIDACLRLLEEYHPADEDQAALARAIDLLTKNEGRFDREPDVHFTASAVVLDSNLQRTLFLKHPRYQRWQQPGGHMDGEANFVCAALREAEEETGLEGLEIWPAIADLIEGPGEIKGHFHLDVRFVVLADSKDDATSPEGLELRWFTLDELREPIISERRRHMVKLAIQVAREAGVF